MSYRRRKRRKDVFKKKSLYGIVFVIIILSIVFVYSSQYSPSNQTTSQTFQFKAAIVDHLSLTYPNQTFIETATNILKQAGYTVDYYPGEEVNVEFYRNLPTHGYGLILLRVHSTAEPSPPLCLFTSEPYSKTKYTSEQLTDKIEGVTYSEEELRRGIGYFGISPEFVKDKYSMKGKFANTIIIMMGCEGLKYDGMAKAFVEKGAKLCIGWDKGVLASHTDQATTQLLQHLITEKQTVKQAVTETMQEVGPDPVDKSALLYYPDEAQNYSIA